MINRRFMIWDIIHRFLQCRYLNVGLPGAHNLNGSNAIDVDGPDVNHRGRVDWGRGDAISQNGNPQKQSDEHHFQLTNDCLKRLRQFIGCRPSLIKCLFQF